MPCSPVAAALALLALASAQSVTYYISPSGSDGAAGTSPAAAWRSAARASALTLQPGDAVLFEGAAAAHELGDGGLLVRGAGPLRVGVYGALPRATLHVDASATFGVRVLDVAGGAEVSNLTLLHTGSGKAQYNGVEAVSSSTSAAAPRLAGGVRLHDLEAAGFLNGVSFSAASCGGFDGVEITRVTASGSLAAGISSYGALGAGSPACYSHANVLLQHCTARDNAGDASNSAGHSGSGIVLAGVDGGRIAWCTAHGNGAHNGHQGGGPVGIWWWGARNAVIEHSLSFNNSNGHAGASSNDGGGFDLDGGCTGCVIQYSLSYGNAGPGFLVCSYGGPAPTRNNTVRFSVSLNDGAGSGNGAAGVNFYTPDSLAGLLVQGNTLVSAAPRLPLLGPTPFGAPASGVRLLGNALLALAGAPLLSVPQQQLPASPPALVRGNAYWGGSAGAFEVAWGGATYASLAALRAGAGLEEGAGGAPTGSDADPGLVLSAWFEACVPPPPLGSALPLLPNSPALDALRGFSGCAAGRG
jgi:hypothetical protein